MKAAILAVGTELLGTRRLDTNSLTITALLERYGVELAGKSVAPDDEDAIAPPRSGDGLGPAARRARSSPEAPRRGSARARPPSSLPISAGVSAAPAAAAEPAGP
jgi:hypothetical protein